MPALRPIPPGRLLELLQRHGFTVRHEDDYNWAMFRPGHDEIVIVPKSGRLVSLDALDRALHAARIDNKAYFDFLAEIPEDELA